MRFRRGKLSSVRRFFGEEDFGDCGEPFEAGAFGIVGVTGGSRTSSSAADRLLASGRWNGDCVGTGGGRMDACGSE